MKSSVVAVAASRSFGSRRVTSGPSAIATDALERGNEPCGSSQRARPPATRTDPAVPPLRSPAGVMLRVASDDVVRGEDGAILSGPGRGNGEKGGGEEKAGRHGAIIARGRPRARRLGSGLRGATAARMRAWNPSQMRSRARCATAS